MSSTCGVAETVPARENTSMTSRIRRRVREQLLALSDDELLEELFSLGNPNPARVGCPPRDVLIELAHRLRPIGDPWYDHCGHCSPCWVEMRAIQHAQRT